MGEITTRVVYAAQYVPRGGNGEFCDLSKWDDDVAAGMAIERNIRRWDAAEILHPGQPASRPTRYRVIKRTVTEEVVSVRFDGAESPSEVNQQ